MSDSRRQFIPQGRCKKGPSCHPPDRNRDESSHTDGLPAIGGRVAALGTALDRMSGTRRKIAGDSCDGGPILHTFLMHPLSCKPVSAGTKVRRVHFLCHAAGIISQSRAAIPEPLGQDDIGQGMRPFGEVRHPGRGLVGGGDLGLVCSECYRSVPADLVPENREGRASAPIPSVDSRRRPSPLARATGPRS